MKVSTIPPWLLWACLTLSSGRGSAQVTPEPAPTAQPDATAPQPVELLARIQQEISAIRGLNFKQPVKLATRSAEELQQRLDARVSAMLPADVAPYYGQIVRKLGLYRGPAIEDFPALMKMVLSTQVAAYYLPAEDTFFMLGQPQSAAVRGALYAHELHHGLQHQNFDLLRFLNPTGRANQDAVLARRAVTEGEATYVMTLWLVQHMSGKLPSREMLAPIIAAQSQLTRESFDKALENSGTKALAGTQLQAAITAMDRIPAFILQTMNGAYSQGLAFVFAVQEGGWSEVNQLFGEQPPVSTEQILHPEKWTAREGFVDFVWPRFGDERRLRGWQLLQEEVLGEFRWRIVFKEHGFAKEAEAAAAGWNGDRYAVFKRKDTEELLLLMRTSWDTPADATEFAELYRRLLVIKYQGTAAAVQVRQVGTEVHIVEGGRATEHAALLRLLNRAQPSRM